MPTRSLNSSVFKWPDLHQVHSALLASVDDQVQIRPDIIKVGYVGSYARGDWGVGSDLDLIVIREGITGDFWGRGLDLDFTILPVPVDVLVYSLQEWEEMAQQGGRFFTTIQDEVVWVYERV